MTIGSDLNFTFLVIMVVIVAFNHNRLPLVTIEAFNTSCFGIGATIYLKWYSVCILIIYCCFTRFTKNLSPDKIQLSTLKGEGELTNLELDEKILMELMDLPTWLELNKAVCNKVNIKVSTLLYDNYISIAYGQYRIYDSM